MGVILGKGMAKGVYVLLIFLPEGKRIGVGKLGQFDFPRGYYVYVGSGLNNLNQRVERHRSRTKKLHWHIDYLLAHAELVDVWLCHTEDRLECRLNEDISRIEGAEVVAGGFGSSDCGCRTHLWRMGMWPPDERIGEGRDRFAQRMEACRPGS